jgi:hypothetical protein
MGSPGVERRTWEVAAVLNDLLWTERVVLAADPEAFEETAGADDRYDVATVDGCTIRHDHDVGEFLADTMQASEVADRADRDDCMLYLARHRETADPVGYNWSLAPEDERVWHDSYPVDPGEALVFDAYVEPEHRERGVYELLQTAAHGRLFESEDCETVYSIVEKEDTPALHANRAVGLRPTARNYLVKFLGVDVLSICRDQYDTRTHLVMGKHSI